MTCAGCRHQCSLSRNGLCVSCRAIAKQPAWMKRRDHSHALRWLAPEYLVLRKARCLTPEQAVVRSEILFRELRATLSAGVILDWKLDNPYMFKHARRTMVSYILHQNLAHLKRPVQSERCTQPRKAVAA